MYYTLVCSLPRLVYFEQAELLPISGERLHLRLSMLTPEDLSEFVAAQDFVSWHKLALQATTSEIGEKFLQLQKSCKNSVLCDYVEFIMQLKTVLAALRLRLAGKQISLEEARYFKLQRWLLNNWDDANFKLERVVPWVVPLAEYVQKDDAVNAEKLLMHTAWQQLARINDLSMFGFEAVFSFMFRWDIVRTWLSFKSDAAATSFHTLIEEIINEKEKTNSGN